jgi:digalactosyldiacylglycerol synthase
MTGTSVNPLLRAAYLHDRLEAINTKHNNNNTANTQLNGTRINSSNSYVTLVFPWLELPEDQSQVYNGRVFQSKNEQELYVRKWLAESANMPDAAAHLKIVFYNARYHADLGSVFAMGDIIQELPPDELDVCVLEEPEHLNWFRAPSMESWTKRYNYVVGVVHTNYDQMNKKKPILKIRSTKLSRVHFRAKSIGHKNTVDDSWAEKRCSKRGVLDLREHNGGFAASYHN